MISIQNRFLVEFFFEKFYDHDDQLVLDSVKCFMLIFSGLKTPTFVNLGLQLLVIISPIIVLLGHLMKS